jgi:hypothetical protein
MLFHWNYSSIHLCVSCLYLKLIYLLILTLNFHIANPANATSASGGAVIPPPGKKPKTKKKDANNLAPTGAAIVDAASSSAPVKSKSKKEEGGGGNMMPVRKAGAGQNTLEYRLDYVVSFILFLKSFLNLFKLFIV